MRIILGMLIQFGLIGAASIIAPDFMPAAAQGMAGRSWRAGTTP